MIRWGFFNSKSSICLTNTIKSEWTKSIVSAPAVYVCYFRQINIESGVCVCIVNKGDTTCSINCWWYWSHGSKDSHSYWSRCSSWCHWVTWCRSHIWRVYNRLLPAIVEISCWWCLTCIKIKVSHSSVIDCWTSNESCFHMV